MLNLSHKSTNALLSSSLSSKATDAVLETALSAAHAGLDALAGAVKRKISRTPASAKKRALRTGTKKKAK